MIVLTLTGMIDIPQILEAIMIQDNLSMIHETIMIQDNLSMIQDNLNMIQDNLSMIHEMIKEVWVIEEVLVDLMRVFKVAEIRMIFNNLGKIEVVEVLKVLRTLMFSYSQIIDETHLINFRQEKGFQQKNCKN